MTTGTCILMDLYIFLLVDHIIVSGMRNETTLSLKAQPQKEIMTTINKMISDTDDSVEMVIGPLPNKLDRNSVI